VAQLLFYLIVLVALAKPLGTFMARVYEGRPCGLDGALGWLERLIYRVGGVRPGIEMGWKTYAIAMLLFNAAGMLFVYSLQRVQGGLPFNPQGFGAVSADSSFNTAASFATNTNWQGYGGESTMSYLTQMLGLTVQNFVSAATGMATVVALIRGFARRTRADDRQFLGRSDADDPLHPAPAVPRSRHRVRLPGRGQTFGPYAKATVVQPTEYDEPIMDRTASPSSTRRVSRRPEGNAHGAGDRGGTCGFMEAIKQLGTNGGGFFNVNSAHPFENPTPLSNFLEVLAILLIPAALCYTFGVMVHDTRQGWVLLAAMTVIFVGMLATAVIAEQRGSVFAKQGVDHTASALQAGGNMEGKEVRFGIANSALWATATTAASNGSVNSMHDSYTPIGGLVPMWMIQLGAVVYGGVGSGLYGMVVFAIVAVFVAGLMVGRTPEYLGKKIEAYEMKMPRS
jgi:K+-transporting ATPase ATPase A chain